MLAVQNTQYYTLMKCYIGSLLCSDTEKVTW